MKKENALLVYFTDAKAYKAWLAGLSLLPGIESVYAITPRELGEESLVTTLGRLSLWSRQFEHDLRQWENSLDRRDTAYTSNTLFRVCNQIRRAIAVCLDLDATVPQPTITIPSAFMDKGRLLSFREWADRVLTEDGARFLLEIPYTGPTGLTEFRKFYGSTTVNQ